MACLIFNIFSVSYSLSDVSTQHLHVKMDKTKYDNSEQAVIDILDSPNSSITLTVINSLSKNESTDNFMINDNGSKTYHLNLISYVPGIYKIMINDQNEKVELNFTIDAMKSGIQFRTMLDKDEYVIGKDTVTISGFVRPNSMVSSVLVDPYGNVDQSKKSLSDKFGSFSLFMPLPSFYPGGIWKIVTSDGFNHERQEAKFVLPGNQTYADASCAANINSKMEKISIFLDKNKAISLAINSNIFQSKVMGYNYTFYDVFTLVDQSEFICDTVKINSVLVEFTIFNSTNSSSLLIYEDPTLTKVTGVISADISQIDINQQNYAILSPLRQHESGVDDTAIKCKEGLSLIIKSENGSPACVKPETVNILIERGWAKSIQ